MQQQMILVAGPYRSGTNDDPVLIEANVKQMTKASLSVYRRGHIPMMGEWVALPLIEEAGSREMGDDIFNEIFHPIAANLINFCDAVVRIGGPSSGADYMLQVAREKGKSVYMSLEEIPEFKSL
ncbi:DUF4406 domain-containing protein [Chitinophaga rhizosphaerae]|uniref:DUF4406 domain-containing protein n=1 Tax=Chitinophaga rhizosphaerae TaxID=1864947 RepID=UPI00196B7C66|nr:DUF4406 domain-containing protein [Chitinophaga rhizosphaerae]